MTDEIYPTVGMAGSFACLAPYNVRVNPQLRYEVVAVEAIKGLIAQGKNPLDDIYLKDSLGIGKYQYDFEHDIKIVTLQAATGDVIKFPSSYILSLPDPNGVRYNLTMLGISLSAVPATLNLEMIKSEIQELIFNRIGVRSEVKEVTYGASTLLTQAEHVSVETARRNNATNNSSNLLRLNQLEVTNARLVERLAMLERYIETHHV